MHANSLSHDCRWKTLYEDEDEDVCFARRRSFIDASVSHAKIRTESAYMHYVLYRVGRFSLRTIRTLFPLVSLPQDVRRGASRVRANAEL